MAKLDTLKRKFVGGCISILGHDFAQSRTAINNNSPEKNNYDIVVANLPYVPTETLQNLDNEVINYEPIIALDGGPDGLVYINELIKQIEENDFKNLTLFLEVDSSHAKTIVKNLNHWKDVKLEKDLVDRDRYIIAKR